MTKAAKILGRQRSHVSRAIATPEFKQYWSDLQVDLFRSVDQRLRHLLLVAAETHLQLLKSEDDDVRFRAVALVYSGPHAAYLSTLRLFDAVPAEPPAPMTVEQARALSRRRLDDLPETSLTP